MSRNHTTIGGVDPAVIRELSGIYKPFVKAFKELISNAYDADANQVKVTVADDLTSIEVLDNGRGLTPLEFRRDFTKIGGSYTRSRGQFTPKGRPIIGSKGIGFLAVARYCSRIEVVSTTTRSNVHTFECTPRRNRIDCFRELEIPLRRDLLPGRLSVKSIEVISENGKEPLLQKYYNQAPDGIIELKGRADRWAGKKFQVHLSLDCRSLEIHAVIDFDYLLSLENQKDLEEIKDFCTLDIYSIQGEPEKVRQHYTRITVQGLKEFVVRELSIPRRQGNVRNVDSLPGIDRFLWNLQRCIPVKYDLPAPIQNRFGKDSLDSTEIKFIERVTFSGCGYRERELKRPLWGNSLPADLAIGDDISAEVRVESDGLVGLGYILGNTEVIFPAEYRGIAVRVRNVQIGSPHFFGFESIATGAAKAALSQITGEINILRGLDAIDALNPGRESFYEENPQYKVLKKLITGEGESVGGLLGRVIRGILTRSQVEASANDLISHANQRRKTLINLSKAINQFATNAQYKAALRKLFLDTPISANGLVQLDDYDIRPTKPVAGFSLESQPGLVQDYSTDFSNRRIYIDFEHDRWSWRIFILGEIYKVVPKAGLESDPLCQLDTVEKKIYINWTHPIRQQMAETAFIKSAIAWSIAFHSHHSDMDGMMNLALRILTFGGA
jgi:hypothetical protein